MADGRVVPSPLSQPTCENCDGHVVRIMRAGQVSTVLDSLRESAHGGTHQPPAPAGAHGAIRRRGGTGGAADSGGRRAGPVRRPAAPLARPNLVQLLHLQRRAH